MKVFHKMDAACELFVDHTDTEMMVYQLPNCAKIFCQESYCCSYCILLFNSSEPLCQWYAVLLIHILLLSRYSDLTL
jgi:hypothetical protein